MKYFLLLSMILVSCGQGGTQAPAPVTPAAPSVSAQTKTCGSNYFCNQDCQKSIGTCVEQACQQQVAICLAQPLPSKYN